MTSLNITPVIPVPVPNGLKNLKNQFLGTIPPVTRSFASRTIIVTGANTSLGFEACKILISLSATRVILACRSISKGETAKAALQAEFPNAQTILKVMSLDMNSYDSVMAFTEQAKREPRVDGVILNAGIWPTSWKMSEGNEESITTNVISTALLACLLHPVLSSTARRFDLPANLTIVSSSLHMQARLDELKGLSEGGIFKALNDEKKSNLADRYNVTKLFEIFIVRELAKVSPFEKSRVVITANAPGFCKSSLQTSKDSAIINFLVNHAARPASVGAHALVFGATCDPGYHGLYTPDNVATQPGGKAAGNQGAELQRKAWRELEGILEGIKGGVTRL